MRHVIWNLILTTIFLIGCNPDPYASKKKAGKPKPIDPEAKAVLSAFRSAVSTSDWQRLLSLCTQTVQSEADKYDSPAEFCQTVLPIEDIMTCKRFDTYHKF